MARPPRWSDAQLRKAVRCSVSLAEVCQRLELRPGGGTYATLHRHIARLSIDDSHLPRWKHGRPQPAGTYTDAELRSAVAECESFAQVIRTLGRRPSGGMHRHIASRVRAMDLDVGHFTGQSWARGRTGRKGFRRIPLEEILIVDSTYRSSGKLRARLIAAGLKQALRERCGLARWQGETVTSAGVVCEPVSA